MEPLLGDATVGTQNPIPQDQSNFRIHHIAPSPRSLEELTGPPYRLNDDPLQDYAAGLLGAFRDLKSAGDYATPARRSLHFQHPLEEILDGWTPCTGDVLYLGGRWEDKYEWNISTASTWITALCRLIRNTKRLANDCRHRHEQLPIRELLSLPSICLRLRLELQDNHTAVSDEDEPEMSPEANEETYPLALRYLRNTAAWQSAIHPLYFREHTEISLRSKISPSTVVIPVVIPDTCAPDEPIVNLAVHHMLEKLHLDREAERVQSVIQEIKNKVSPVHFCGTVHCDASLMGMVVASMDNAMPLPNGMTLRKLRVIKKLVTILLLVKRLHAADPRVTFDIPASGGLIFPWASPTVGMPVAVAWSMEAALTVVWEREVMEFIREFTKASARSKNSPSGSICGDFEDAQDAGMHPRQRLNRQVV
ncbi:hypothetical protein BS47DRAFT_1489110 [Hydnum rufescens UP504]|uniref:Uncharacterized protein n=1 Tax=Hydnum rufescens UP504 TaxID=1448309 RepID=A0A9P6AJN4_9AGAM|nr:hypothetical protein BS47DRAFT_1489110 [Hydnum rufescens UP504]